MLSFVKRELKITINFTEGDTLVLDGYRVTCDIELAGEYSMPIAKLKIFGLDQSLMSRITTYVWNQQMISENVVSVEANGSLVHKGNIVTAYADYSGMPDVFMYLEIATQAYNQVRPIPVKSYPAEAVQVTDIIRELAKDMNLAYIPGNVDAVLYKPYFTGSAIDQLRAVCQASNTEFFINNDTILTTKMGSAIVGIVHTINAESGMVGYPVMQSNAINLTILFNPVIKPGAVVDIESTVFGANGRWKIASASYKLDSNMPNGRWFADFQGISSKLYEDNLGLNNGV